MLMVFLTFVDVFLRYWFGKSINGTVEITELMMVIVVFSSTAYTQWQKSHVTMDILTSKLTEPAGRCSPSPRRCGRWRPSVSVLYDRPVCGFDLVGHAGAADSAYPIHRARVVRLRPARRHPAPRSAESAFGSLPPRREPAGRPRPLPRCLPMLAHGGSPRTSCRYGQRRRGVLGLVFLFALFFLGMPVAFCSWPPASSSSPTCAAFRRASRPSASPCTRRPAVTHGLPSCSSCSWAICFTPGSGRTSTAARKWLGHLRGGLAVGSVAACALFGAVVGDVLAGSIAMAAIALPEMRKHGYNDELAVGTLACSGPSAASSRRAPPSSFTACWRSNPSATLFVAGIIPGLLCALCFMAAVAHGLPQAGPRP